MVSHCYLRTCTNTLWMDVCFITPNFLCKQIFSYVNFASAKLTIYAKVQYILYIVKIMTRQQKPQNSQGRMTLLLEHTLMYIEKVQA